MAEKKIGNGDSLVTALQGLIREMTEDLTQDMQKAKNPATETTEWMIHSIRADCTKEWLAKLAGIVANAQAFIRPLNLE